MKNEIRLMPDDAFAPWYLMFFSSKTWVIRWVIIITCIELGVCTIFRHIAGLPKSPRSRLLPPWWTWCLSPQRKRQTPNMNIDHCLIARVVASSTKRQQIVLWYVDLSSYISLYRLKTSHILYCTWSYIHIYICIYIHIISYYIYIKLLFVVVCCV